MDLDAEELPADTVAELADSTVHLSSPVDLSPEALETLRRELPRPACFERSGWLSGCYALLLPGGSREFPRFTVAHHPVRGVEIHEEEGM